MWWQYATERDRKIPALAFLTVQSSRKCHLPCIRHKAAQPRSFFPIRMLKNQLFDARKPDALVVVTEYRFFFWFPRQLQSRRGPVPSIYITEMACMVRHNVVGLFSCTNRLFLVALSNTCFWLVRNDGAFECWVKPQTGRCDSATLNHNLSICMTYFKRINGNFIVKAHSVGTSVSVGTSIYDTV